MCEGPSPPARQTEKWSPAAKDGDTRQARRALLRVDPISGRR
jgi:hypothetical protein